MNDQQRQMEYANDQHELACIKLEISTKHDDSGDTLFEAVVALMKDRDEWKEEAALRSNETEVFKHNVKLLADELKSENEKAIDWFIHANEIKEDLRNALQWIDDGTDQEGRDLIVGPLRAKHFPPKADPGLDSENARAVTPGANEKPLK
jgi:hypothetical protein